ncbi:MAG: hypothetical protein NTZ04_00020 [Chloroflexi bacterium]|nr:hypothetical protein [Chloroflexota bacterium]
MANGDAYRRKLAYEKALEIRYHQVELGYQMFNYFLVGMSFLIVAFATIVASGRASELHAASWGIVILGMVLSAIFAIVGFFATETVRKYDYYLLKTEDKAKLANGPFKTILSNASDLPFTKGLEGGAAHHFSFRPSMAWCIPAGFFFFWVYMLVVVCVC